MKLEKTYFCGKYFGNSPPNIYFFKFNKSNTRKSYEIYSKITIKTAERRHAVLVFLLLILSIFPTFFQCFIVDFEQVNFSWGLIQKINPIQAVSFLYLLKTSTCFKGVYRGNIDLKLVKMLNMLKVNNKHTRMIPMNNVVMSLLIIWGTFSISFHFHYWL